MRTGDRVRVTASGAEGRIIAMRKQLGRHPMPVGGPPPPPPRWICRVRHDDGHFWNYQPDELEVIE